MILKGTGKINGDGWKDTTRIGDVVYVWNQMLPPPYAPGQYPRLGNSCWSASTEQYDFVPATLEEAKAYVEHLVEAAEARGEKRSQERAQKVVYVDSRNVIDD